MKIGKYDIDPGRLITLCGRQRHRRLRHRLSLDPEGGYEGGDLGGRRLALHNFRHNVHHLHFPQVFTRDHFRYSFPDHALRFSCHRSRAMVSLQLFQSNDGGG
jgi:hypothetical protein